MGCLVFTLIKRQTSYEAVRWSFHIQRSLSTTCARLRQYMHEKTGKGTRRTVLLRKTNNSMTRNILYLTFDVPTRSLGKQVVPDLQKVKFCDKRYHTWIQGISDSSTVNFGSFKWPEALAVHCATLKLSRVLRVLVWYWHRQESNFICHTAARAFKCSLWPIKCLNTDVNSRRTTHWTRPPLLILRCRYRHSYSWEHSAATIRGGKIQLPWKLRLGGQLHKQQDPSHSSSKSY